MVRGFWSSDVLLLWEKEHGQQIKAGYTKNLKKTEIDESKDT